MNARLYDPLLHRFLAPDNYVQNPYSTQNFNRYGYVLNNPLKYNDPSGEIVWLAPMLYGILSGALIGAATSAVVYSISAAMTGNWSWSGFGKSILYGAVAGAISGGISGAFSGSAGAFFQSTTFNVLKETAAQVGTTLAFGGSISKGTIIGSIAAGFVGAKIGGWKAVKGSWLKNAIGEVAFSTGRGAVTGLVAGGTGALVDGNDMGQGMLNGARNGAMGGFAQSVGMVLSFGATRQLSSKQEKYITAIQNKYNFKGAYTVRRGGLYQLFFNRDVTWGNTIIAHKNTSADVYGHEYGHIYQYYTQGWAQFQGKGIYEEFLYLAMGIDPYITPGYNEHKAEFMLQGVGGCTIYDINNNCVKL